MIICLDTNSYRYIVEDEIYHFILDEQKVREKIQDIVNREFARNIKACLSPIVAMELFAHLADKNDPHYENCKMALLASNIHCQEIEHRPRILMDADVQMCNMLFGKIPNDMNTDIQKRICAMTYELYKDTSENNMEKLRQNFKSLNKYVESKEKTFLKDAIKVKQDIFSKDRSIEEQKKLKKYLYTRIKKGDLLIAAYSQFERVCDILGIKIEDVGINKKKILLKVLKEKFVVPLRFYDDFLKSILDSDGKINLDDESKGNYFWDFYIMFNVGNFTFMGNEVKLITEDCKMHTAAEKTGFKNKVLSLKDYLNTI